MKTGKESLLLSTGIFAAVGASICCILPVAVAFLGVGSAALGATFEPFRPYLLGLTVLLLGGAFYQSYKPKKDDCEPGESCSIPENRRRNRILLWVVAGVAILLVTFPYYIEWIL